MEEDLPPEILAARARLRERCGQQTQQIGGKGTIRRKTKKTHKSVVGDDRKLQLTLKRLGATSIFGVEEVLLLRANRSALHFVNPKVQAAPASNTYVIAGHCEERANATSILGMRGVLGGAGGSLDPSSISPDVLRQLQQHVEALSRKERHPAALAPAGGAGDTLKDKMVDVAEEEEEEEVPDLVENFEEISRE